MPRRSFYTTHPIEVEQIVSLYLSGLTINEVASKTVIDRSHIVRTLRKRGVLRTKASAARLTATFQRSLTRITEAAQMAKAGASPMEIASHLRVSRTAVRRLLTESGLPTRSRKHMDDWSLYPITPDKAWFIGLLIGNGNVSKDLYVTNMTSGDSDILEKVKAIVGGHVPVRAMKTYGRVDICSKRICEEFAGLGIVPAKAHKITFPNIATILHRHVVRGLADTDGCWAWRRERGRVEFAYVSVCEQFVYELQSVIRNGCGARTINIHRSRVGIWRIKYGSDQSSLIADWVYAGNTEHMRCNRKYLAAIRT